MFMRYRPTVTSNPRQSQRLPHVRLKKGIIPGKSLSMNEEGAEMWIDVVGEAAISGGLRDMHKVGWAAIHVAGDDDEKKRDIGDRDDSVIALIHRVMPLDPIEMDPNLGGSDEEGSEVGVISALETGGADGRYTRCGG